jgi:hypothetical protein
MCYAREAVPASWHRRIGSGELAAVSWPPDIDDRRGEPTAWRFLPQRRTGRLETMEDSRATRTHRQPRPAGNRVAQGQKRSTAASLLPATKKGERPSSAGTSTCGDMQPWRRRRRSSRSESANTKGSRPETRRQRRSKRRRRLGRPGPVRRQRDRLGWSKPSHRPACRGATRIVAASAFATRRSHRLQLAVRRRLRPALGPLSADVK